MRLLIACLLIPLAVRAALAAELQLAVFSPTAIVSEFATGVVLYWFCCLTGRWHHLLATAVLLSFCLFSLASAESVVAINKVVDLRDLAYGLDGNFLRSSLARLSFPVLSLLLLGSALWATLSGPRNRVGTCNSAVALSALVLLLVLPASNWQQANLLAVSIQRASVAGGIDSNSIPAVPTSAVRQQGQTLRSAGPPARNIILLVMEGIPGAYLQQVQLTPALQALPSMPALSRLAQQGLMLPNFTTHSPQTIRGLYAMLCGDYSKLSLDTFKAGEYLNLNPDQQPTCLPRRLRQAGYQTLYLQAADLSYMEKDRFMPAIGFQQVQGRASLPATEADIGWGPDDRTFLRQAAQRIIEQHRRPQPFFTTLLTVGTHHPYTLPKAMQQRGAERKLAAVQYLDRAIGEFARELADAGVLNDSLLLITSDESHGLPGIVAGGNWGALVALAPDLPATIHNGLYGLKDIQFSVLDYLGIETRPGGTSVFRDYPNPPSLLAWSDQLYLLSPQTGISWCEGSQQCWHSPSQQSLLFSASGENAPVPLTADASRTLVSRIEAMRQHADAKLKLASSRDAGIFIREQSFELVAGMGRFLQAGKYLALDADNQVTVTLRARFHSAEPGASVEIIETVNNARAASTERLSPALEIAPLHDGEVLQMSYQFRPAVSVAAAQPVLFARLHGEHGQLHIEEYSISSGHAGNSAPAEPVVNITRP